MIGPVFLLQNHGQAGRRVNCAAPVTKTQPLRPKQQRRPGSMRDQTARYVDVVLPL